MRSKNTIRNIFLIAGVVLLIATGALYLVGSNSTPAGNVIGPKFMATLKNSLIMIYLSRIFLFMAGYAILSGIAFHFLGRSGGKVFAWIVSLVLLLITLYPVYMFLPVVYDLVANEPEITRLEVTRKNIEYTTVTFRRGVRRVEPRDTPLYELELTDGTKVPVEEEQYNKFSVGTEFYDVSCDDTRLGVYSSLSYSLPTV